MDTGSGLSTDKGLEQVRLLVECGDIDLVEISDGNAENETSKLHSKLLAASAFSSPFNVAFRRIHLERRQWTRPRRCRRAPAFEKLILPNSWRELRSIFEHPDTALWRLSLKDCHGRCD